MKLWYVSKSGESVILSILLRFVLPLINAEYASLKFRPYKLVTLECFVLFFIGASNLEIPSCLLKLTVCSLTPLLG